jgi:RNA polymerase sigma factor
VDLSSEIREMKGNEALRERYIASQKEAVRRYASHICRRHLDWSNDDELSIALMAFNAAIDTYDPASGSSFAAYSRLLIRHSLVDYFRKQGKAGQEVFLSGEEPAQDPENTGAWGRYQQELERRERVYDIQFFIETLAEFKLSLDDLVQLSPRHGDTRDRLKGIALKVASQDKLVKTIYKRKRLPLREIAALTGTPRKFLEYWRKYLLSLVIVLTREELASLADYIKGRKNPDEES